MPGPVRKAPVPFDVWVCHGRVCTAGGADLLATRARDGAALSEGACRVLRGGCYGLCELGPNLVVRERAGDAALDEQADRLSLTGRADETVYCAVAPADVDRILDAHRRGAGPVAELTREAREASLPPGSSVAARLRRLRQRRRAAGALK